MMNIKILEPIPESEVLITIPFGSQVYGTADENSDRDYVKILKPNTGELLLQYQSPPFSIHPLDDYKHKVDYIYTNLNNFLEGAWNGANTIFFECLHTPEFKIWFEEENELEGSYYNLIWDNKAILNKYNSRIAKAYLGLAKRDLHYLDRQHHVMRCIWMAEKIIKKELIDLSEVAGLPKTLTSSPEETLEYITTLRKGLKYND